MRFLLLQSNAAGQQDEADERPVFRLQFRDGDGATLVWAGRSKSEAIAVADKWTRNGIRLVDMTEGAQ